MNKKTFVAVLALLILATATTRKTSAQECPNQMTFGVHTTMPVDKSLQSQIEVTYFTTDDPNVFLSESAGITKSASYMHLGSDQFSARLSQLEKQGVASIKKQQSAISFLGEMAELNLERNPASKDARIINTAYSTADTTMVSPLDRKTEISISKGSSMDGEYFRMAILSWFVSESATGSQRVVDYDASILIKPGETAIFKMRSDYELQRNGSARSYLAVTMRSVNGADSARTNRTRQTASGE